MRSFTYLFILTAFFYIYIFISPKKW